MFKIDDVKLSLVEIDRTADDNYKTGMPPVGYFWQAELPGSEYEAIGIEFESADLLKYTEKNCDQCHYLPANERQQLIDGTAKFVVWHDGGNQAVATLVEAVQHIVDCSNHLLDE